MISTTGSATTRRAHPKESSVPGPRPLNIGQIGAGRIGSSHAELLVPGVRLVAVADPAAEVAARLAEELGVPAAYTDPGRVVADDQVEAIVITAQAPFHAGLVEQAAAAGKAVFCEKPAGLTMGEIDRVQEAVQAHGVVFQVGFDRRFADGFPEARRAVGSGRIGRPRLLRSVTRDPGPADPTAVAPWTIFLDTLIHDFDILNFLNPGARAVQVHAVASHVAPDVEDAGLLDTAVVTVRFDNGAIATAEAGCSAAYGYDTRAEVFGTGGMVTVGRLEASSMRCYGPEGLTADTVRHETRSMRGAYSAELQVFADAARGGPVEGPGVADARQALRIALACVESCRTGGPVEPAP
ncbi:Gfo/Idh/MocA family oxidoreductase [Kocuria sp. M1R5S2]|uniref:Gfo/Idh/MocA family oxidoreductase n=1 Tax=Kocuria rhizosphaerae TaxID=3376285 RepID=UPI0037974C2D